MDGAENLNFRIPWYMGFESLGLRLTEEGRLRIEWAPIEVICEESGMDSSVLALGPPIILVMLLDDWLTLLEREGRVSGDDLEMYRLILLGMRELANELATMVGGVEQFHVSVKMQAKPTIN